MSFTKESATDIARRDLAARLGVSESDVEVSAVNDREFPDMSLGAPANGEASAQMISDGWQIRLKGSGKEYEYRADKYQIRLVGFEGSNHLIKG